MRSSAHLLPLLLLLMPGAASADVIHVDADAAPGGDGLRWATAYSDLNDALARARSGDSVWVAEGLYRPDEADPERSFTVPSGVSVVGGFAGTETQPGLADPAVHLTVLSGDLAGDDRTHADGITGHPDDIVGVNARHVVRVVDAENVRLSGIVVTAGDAVEGAVGTHGGGVLIHDADVWLMRVHVVGNRAGAGGVGDGAGVYCESPGDQTVRISDSNFVSNAAARRGGAVAVYGCDVDLSRTGFFGNRAGGPESSGTCAGALRGGGALHAAGAARVSVAVRDVRFEDNEAACRGGAIALWDAHLEMDRSWFRRNRAFAPDGPGAAGNGGAAHLSDSSADFRETVGLANVAEQAGGAFYLESSDVRVVNGTFLDNRAVFGPLSRVDGEGSAVFDVANSILQMHGPSPVSIPSRVGASLQARVVSSLLDVDFESADMASCVLGEPTFLEPSARPSERLDVRLSPASAGLGMADATRVSSTRDVAGQMRWRGDQVDVGASQSRVRCAAAGTTRLYAMPREGGAANGESWQDPVGLADALAFVDRCPGVAVSSIWLGGGTHRPDRGAWVEPGDVEARFELPAYVAVRGGFAGTEMAPSDRDDDPRLTVLSGDLDQDDPTDARGLSRAIEGNNSRHVVVASTPGGLLERVAITGGDAVGARGGGLWVDGSDATFQELVVAGNHAEVGAGIAVQGEAAPHIRRSMIAGNEARMYGGGVAVDGTSARFDNVVLSGNVAPTGAGGWLARTEATFDFVDIVGNRASERAGGLYLADGAQPRVAGSVLHGNRDARDSARDANLTVVGAATSAWLSSSIVEGTRGIWSGGMEDMGDNLDVDPQFVRALDPADAPSSDGDYRLAMGSPARDRGPAVHDIGMVDMSRAPRALDGDGDGVAHPDIGALEAAAVAPRPDAVQVAGALELVLDVPEGVAAEPSPEVPLAATGCSVARSGGGALPAGWLLAALVFMRRRRAHAGARVGSRTPR